MTSPVKYSLRSELFAILLLVLSVAFGIYFYLHFPQTVITHWDFNGQPNGYSNRFVGALLIPLILVAIYLMFLALPLFDPKRERYQSFAGIYHFFKNIILAALFAIFLISGYVNLGHSVKVNLLVPLVIGVMFILMGNYLGKLKKNWFVGIRTPWTMSSENVWNKTHRLGGWLMALFGVLMIVTPFLPQAAGMPLFIAGLVLVVAGSFGYSYYAYRQEQREPSQLDK